MTLDQLMEEWRKDATIDSTELGTESTKIPELHSKYLKLYFDERRVLKGTEFQSKDNHRLGGGSPCDQFNNFVIDFDGLGCCIHGFILLGLLGREKAITI